MAIQKKQWHTPQLIILDRGSPEEFVLTHCKRIDDKSGTTPSSEAQVGCDKGVNENCGNCQSRSGS